jgi:hypothetical protein
MKQSKQEAPILAPMLRELCLLRRQYIFIHFAAAIPRGRTPPLCATPASFRLVHYARLVVAVVNLAQLVMVSVGTSCCVELRDIRKNGRKAALIRLRILRTYL